MCKNYFHPLLSILLRVFTCLFYNITDLLSPVSQVFHDSLMSRLRVIGNVKYYVTL